MTLCRLHAFDLIECAPGSKRLTRMIVVPLIGQSSRWQVHETLNLSSLFAIASFHPKLFTIRFEICNVLRGILCRTSTSDQCSLQRAHGHARRHRPGALAACGSCCFRWCHGRWAPSPARLFCRRNFGWTVKQPKKLRPAPNLRSRPREAKAKEEMINGAVVF